MDKRHNGDEEADYNDEEENELFKVEYKNAEIEQQSVKEDAAEDDDEVMTVPPDGGWGWVVVVASFLIFMITEGIIYGFGIFFQEMINDLKCSRSQISMIAALKTSSICFSGPFSAALINKHGFRFVGVLGTILASTSTAISSLFDNIALLTLTYSVFGGLGFGMLYVAAVIVLGFYFERWRSLATGISLCGAGMGCTILPPALTTILNYCGWRFTFVIKGVILLICGLCSLTFKPLKPMLETGSGSGLNLEKNCSTLQEEDSNASKIKFNFFDRYHNTSFPTVAETKGSSLTILLPQKMDRCESSVTVFHSVTSRKTIRTSKMLSPVLEMETESVDSGGRNRCGKLRGFCGRFFKKNTSDLKRTVSLRPLYRDDIFYHGSMNLIPEYRRSMQSKTVTTVIPRN